MSAELDEPSRVERFRTWRHQRPFVAGLLEITAGAVILAPAYISLHIMDLLVVISTISGVSTLFLGVLLIMFGLGTWLKPTTAPYLGVLSIIVGVVALPTSNFGGFILGTVLAIVGGSMGLAWEGKEPVAKEKKSRRWWKKKKNAEEVAETPASDTPVEVPENESSTTTSANLVLVAIVTCISLVFSAAQVHPEAKAEDTGGLEWTGDTSSVTADEVVVSGNAKVGLVTVNTQQGPMRMIELSGNKVTVENIVFSIPGVTGSGQLSTGPGKIATLTGHPAVLRTRTLTATPALEGVSTFPITVEADGNLALITEQLKQLGFTEVGLPEELIKHVALRNVHMDALGVQADLLDAPSVNLYTN
ncbi:DUF6114 domain-containing protein [Corynebacterium poyangense]|uniref:DUF6114 domain-containing protein n=1 Tax=Corynebacterium poyangense TaxID=2684405 RepID=UPI001CCEA60F|nr:DUF6114 domain-containing protein [Corynebacterium poyangense]